MSGFSDSAIPNIIGFRVLGNEYDAVDSMAHDSRPNLLRRVILALVVALLFYGGRQLFFPSRTILRTGPMVQIPEPSRLSISWQMRAISGGAVLLKYPDGHTAKQTADQDGDRFEASFDNLAAGTTYSYTVRRTGLILDDTVAGPYDVNMPPKLGTPFRFLAFGDSGNGSNTQSDLAHLMVAAKPDLIIHAGDLIYPSGLAADYPPNFFEPYADLIRRIPFMPTLGNHDVATDHGAPFLREFELPRNGPAGIEPERNYWFDFGDARFVGLDSNPPEENGVITPEQRETIIAPWLRKVLTESRARWKFVYYHHPFYTGSEHPESGGDHMKKPFMKVYEECGVDMVICGHNHLFERTAPMRAEKIMPDGEGVVYITSGAGGASKYPERVPSPPYIRAFNDSVFSFSQIDITADTLEFQQIGEDGKPLDHYLIKKGRSS